VGFYIGKKKKLKSIAAMIAVLLVLVTKITDNDEKYGSDITPL